MAIAQAHYRAGPTLNAAWVLNWIIEHPGADHGELSAAGADQWTYMRTSDVRRAVSRALRELVREDRVVVMGRGVKGDPKRYSAYGELRVLEMATGRCQCGEFIETAAGLHCAICHKRKDRDQFDVSNNRPTKRSHRCKDCRRIQRWRKRRRESPDYEDCFRCREPRHIATEFPFGTRDVCRYCDDELSSRHHDGQFLKAP
ncbi:MAG: hypothetical protein J2P17_07935 [Mycobacterium sp.]|nr:hypothetical protein [Mycobacterium sp.]